MEQDKAKRNNKKIIYIFLILAVILIIFVGIAIYKYITRDTLTYYEEKMARSGLAQRYNNGIPNDNDIVTKSEAVKMIVEAIIYGEDISDYTPILSSEYYPNFTWVYYAKNSNIIDFDYITEKNEFEQEKYINVIIILNNVLEKNYFDLSKIEKIVPDSDIVIKKQKQYTEEEKKCIANLISYGIIPNGYKYSKNQILSKKLFNELLIKFDEKVGLLK